MNLKKVILRGSYLDQLVNELRNYFPDLVVRIIGNVTILVEESFSSRISANLSTTVILNYAEFDYCEVDIITAGGDVGFLNLGYGAGQARIENFMQMLESICNSRHWKIEVII